VDHRGIDEAGGKVAGGRDGISRARAGVGVEYAEVARGAERWILDCGDKAKINIVICWMHQSTTLGGLAHTFAPLHFLLTGILVVPSGTNAGMTPFRRKSHATGNYTGLVYYRLFNRPGPGFG
jgi:hypothetical protein